MMLASLSFSDVEKAKNSLVGTDRPRFPTPGESDLRGRIARESVESLLKCLGALNGLVERVRVIGRDSNERRAGVNDCDELARCCFAVDGGSAVPDNPVAGVGHHGVELNIAGVERAVRATDKEFGPGLARGELESERSFLHRSLLHSTREEGVLEDSSAPCIQ